MDLFERQWASYRAVVNHNLMERRHGIDHLNRFDIPADRAAMQSVAEAAGWRWRWAWNGTHRSEAVAVLTPA